MNLSHMAIDPLAFRERLHAHPANVCLTLGAHHMVTALCVFDGDIATRTALHIVLLHPFFEQNLTPIDLCASQAVVSLRVTIGAYA